MAVDFMHIIQETESNAEELLKRSVEEERLILAKARADARKGLEQAMAEAEQQAKELLLRTSEEAVRKKGALKMQVEEECRLLLSMASERSGALAEEFAERIVSAYVRY